MLILAVNVLPVNCVSWVFRTLVSGIVLLVRISWLSGHSCLSRGISIQRGAEVGRGSHRRPKPRKPRHFDGIKGGRKRDSDTFTHKNSGSCI